jgi:hypothetical protein
MNLRAWMLSLAIAGSTMAADNAATAPSEAQPAAADPKAQAAEELSIGLNPRVSPIWQERIAFYNRAKEIAAQFAAEPAKDPKSPSKTDSKAQKALKALLGENQTRAMEGVLSCLDSRTTSDVNTRLGALRAIEASQYTHPTVSQYLAASAIGDPERLVRATAVATIKARKDDPAIGGMIQYLMSSFDDKGNVLNPDVKAGAVEALQTLNDRRVFEALQYYVTMELRVTNTELANFATRQIDSFSVNNGANVSVLVPLSFPIQFPELKITRVRTTVKCPAASSLEALTGMNFGEDVDKWAKFFAKK